MTWSYSGDVGFTSNPCLQRRWYRFPPFHLSITSHHLYTSNHPSLPVAFSNNDLISILQIIQTIQTLDPMRKFHTQCFHPNKNLAAVKVWAEWTIVGETGPSMQYTYLQFCSWVPKWAGRSKDTVAKQWLFYTFNGGIMVAKLVNIDSGCWMVGSVWGDQNHIVGWERPS